MNSLKTKNSFQWYFLWFSLKNDNLGLKIKSLKFLGIHSRIKTLRGKARETNTTGIWLFENFFICISKPFSPILINFFVILIYQFSMKSFEASIPNFESLASSEKVKLRSKEVKWRSNEGRSIPWHKIRVLAWWFLVVYPFDFCYVLNFWSNFPWLDRNGLSSCRSGLNRGRYRRFIWIQWFGWALMDSSSV